MRHRLGREWIVLVIVLAAACAATDARPGRGAGTTDGPDDAPLDQVKLINGDTVDGTILAQDAEAVVLAHGYGTLSIPQKLVVSVWRAPRRVRPDQAAFTSGRLVTLSSALRFAATRPWAAQLKQVPATVIDQGVLRAVPYVSHRAGTLELNVYGDPAAPAGVEVGNYGDSTAALEELRTVMAGLLTDAGDRELLAGMSLSPGRRERDGLTLEISPPDAPDAYGGWWITAFDLLALDRARASDQELRVIAAPAPVPAATPAPPTPTAPPPAAVTVAAPVTPPPAAPTHPTAAAGTAGAPSTTTPSAAPATAAPPAVAGSPIEEAIRCAEGDASACSKWSDAEAAAASKRRVGGKTGRVFLRGYSREDGAYAPPPQAAGKGNRRAPTAP